MDVDTAAAMAARRLRRLAAAVAAGLGADDCETASRLLVPSGPSASIAEMEGAAIGRLTAARVALLSVGERGVPLGSESELQLVFSRHGLEAMVVSAVDALPPDTEILVTMGAQVDLGVLARVPKLKLVAVAFTGTDHVDISACKSRHIAVVHVPSYSTDATAELAIGMVLEHLRKLPECHQIIRDGSWACPPQEDLRSKAIGIVGVGKIGLRLAEIFRTFKVRSLVGYSISKPSEFTTLGGVWADSLAEVFFDSDIICVCVPLNMSTEGLISDKLMALLRPGSLLVNVSRGSVVDELALVKYLNQRRFRAALDVFSIEPLPADSPLRSLPPGTLLMTPHIGYQSEASLAKRMEVTVKNILAYLAGQPINVVSK